MNEATLHARSAAIGKTLRIVRERTGRNQAEVAGSAGISPSMLSQIERGAVSPSLDTLFAVCAALDFDIADLFRRLSPSKPVRVVHEQNRLRSSSGGGVRLEQLVASVHQAYPAEMFLLEIAAGRQHGISGRGHEGVELGTVLAGRAALTVDGETYELREGDSVSFDCKFSHRITNAGPGVFRAVWTVLPPHRDYLDIDKGRRGGERE
ncbi:MAG: cupin domain-containing protein [Chitinivibrionales bacterium]|nr:cupin domain-containing protein [Chitinivibrionales bacterium]